MTSAKVLIVDDEPQIRRVLRTTLASHGYTVVEARSGDEALEEIRHERPDLILLDVNMPGRSGLETCSEIRATSDVRSSCSPSATASAIKCSRSTRAPTITS